MQYNRNVNCKLQFLLKSYILFSLHFTDNTLGDVKAPTKLLPCRPSPEMCDCVIMDAKISASAHLLNVFVSHSNTSTHDDWWNNKEVYTTTKGIGRHREWRLICCVYVWKMAWNSLPPDIRAAASPAMFKKLLKTHFFNTAFSTC